VIPHIDIVQALEEQLGFRHIAIASEEYAVTKDGKNFFGVMTLDQGMDGASFALGVRNSHSKQFRLSIVVGLRVFVCSNLSFSGDFIVVDECHRGSARDESNWREILEYFEDAYQIGMTATPLRQDNRDTYRYFKNPIYTYSLRQGIDDGFLAPYQPRRQASHL
jgi:hypothetical protein